MAEENGRNIEDIQEEAGQVSGDGEYDLSTDSEIAENDVAPLMRKWGWSTWREHRHVEPDTSITRYTRVVDFAGKVVPPSVFAEILIAVEEGREAEKPEGFAYIEAEPEEETPDHIQFQMSREKAIRLVKPLMEDWGWATDGNQYGQQDPESQIVVYTRVMDYSETEVPLTVFDGILKALDETGEITGRPVGFVYKDSQGDEEPAGIYRRTSVTHQVAAAVVAPLMERWGWSAAHGQYRENPALTTYIVVKDHGGVNVPLDVFAEILHECLNTGTAAKRTGLAYKESAEEKPPEQEESVPPFTPPRGFIGLMGGVMDGIRAVAPGFSIGGQYEIDVTLPAVIGGMRVESGRRGDKAFLEFIAGDKSVRIAFPLDDAIKVTRAAARNILDAGIIGGMENLKTYAKDPEKVAAILPAFLDVARQFMGEDAFNNLKETLDSVSSMLSGLFADPLRTASQSTNHEPPPEPSEAEDYQYKTVPRCPACGVPTSIMLGVTHGAAGETVKFKCTNPECSVDVFGQPWPEEEQPETQVAKEDVDPAGALADGDPIAFFRAIDNLREGGGSLSILRPTGEVPYPLLEQMDITAVTTDLWDDIQANYGAGRYLLTIWNKVGTDGSQHQHSDHFFEIAEPPRQEEQEHDG